MGDFNKIQFGKADADSELAYASNLLIEGYFDSYEYVENILSRPDIFLVIGSKGSGKTALACKLKTLGSYNDSKLFVKSYSLKDFPYNDFDQILPGKEAPETRYPMNWDFLLCVAIINSIFDDEMAELSIETDIKKARNIFGKLGLIEDIDLSDLVKTVVKKEFEINLRGCFKAKFTPESSKKDLMDKLFRGVMKFCKSIQTPNQHIITIDGLDDVLTGRKRQLSSLSALISGTSYINKLLAMNHINVKIVLLCRMELIDRLKDPNMNKIVIDSKLHLDWYQDIGNVSDTNLVKLINHRAKTSLKKEVDVFNDYFFSGFTSETSSADVTLKKLLDATRYTPRDMIQLMNHIQRVTSGSIVRPEDVKAGIKNYSKNYFKGEIRDELVGLIDNNEIDLVFELIMAYGKSSFTLSEIEAKASSDDRFSNFNFKKVFSALYNCNAIGNYEIETKHFSWKARNRESNYSPNQMIIVHRGLHKALELTFRQLPQKRDIIYS